MVSRSDEALELKKELGRPLTRDELMVFLFAQEVADWAAAIERSIKEAM
jgi:hypothetical protein